MNKKIWFSQRKIQQISDHYFLQCRETKSRNISSARVFFPTIRDAQISEVKSLFRCWIEQKKKTDNKFSQIISDNECRCLFGWRFWECLEILSIILRNSEKATKESSHRSKTRPRNGKKIKIWLSLLRFHLKILSIRRKVMGSRVDKFPLFHRNKQVFFTRDIICGWSLAESKNLFENWENSRAMMKRNWR